MTWTPELFIILGSPSLRGSGLKYHSPERESETLQVSLFTREWIEIIKSSACDSSTFSSPSLRGSGLKSPRSWSPNTTMVSVSLFTREWIEMCAECTQDDDGLCLPLYEGVD